MAEWVNVTQALTTYRADLIADPRQTDGSAELQTIRDEIARGLLAGLGSEGLYHVHGHPPNAIGTPYPWALPLWESGPVPAEAFNPTAAGGFYETLGSGDLVETADLAILFAVGSLSGTLDQLQTAAERWQLPFLFWLWANPTLGGLVAEEAQYRGFTFEQFTWGDNVHYCGVGHLRLRLQRVPPARVS